MHSNALLYLALGALTASCSPAQSMQPQATPPSLPAKVSAVKLARAGGAHAAMDALVPAGWTLEMLWRPRSETPANEALTLVVRSPDDGAACVFAERVKGEWLSYSVDLDPPVAPSDCTNVLQINDRWVFAREEFGGYETYEGGHVDTSWFELFAVEDGRMRKVYPVPPNDGFREVAPGTSMGDAYEYRFGDSVTYLQWTADGRSIVQLIPRRRHAR